MRCSRCGRRAVIYVRRLRQALCPEHLGESIARRAEKVLVKAGARDARVLVAVSGGKDSSCMLWALSQLADKLAMELVPVHIDLGIKGFSQEVREAAARLCSALGLKLRLFSLEESLGLSVPEATRTGRSPCSACGVIKRYVLNYVALREEAQLIATGHTLDDLAVFALKAFMTGNIAQLVKVLPHTPSLNHVPGRVKPLAEVSDKETLTFDLSTGVPFTYVECPFIPRRGLDLRLRAVLNELEWAHPGIKLSTLRSCERLKEALGDRVKMPPLTRCKVCGMPSSREVCSFCRLVHAVTGSFEPVLRLWERL